MFSRLLVLALCLLPLTARAEDSIRMLLVPALPLQAEKPVRVQVRLTHAGGEPVAPQELKPLRGEPLPHLHLVDAGLTDYQEIILKPGDAAGNYEFTFTPHRKNPYRAWAELVLLRDRSWHLAEASLIAPRVMEPLEREFTNSAAADGFTYVIGFEQPLKAGILVTGNLTVFNAERHAVTRLQPVERGFAQIAAVNEDFSTLALGAMKEEVQSPDAKGGPRVTFTLTPPRAGFYRVFATTRIDGKVTTVPCGIMVR